MIQDKACGRNFFGEKLVIGCPFSFYFVAQNKLQMPISEKNKPKPIPLRIKNLVRIRFIIRETQQETLFLHMQKRGVLILAPLLFLVGQIRVRNPILLGFRHFGSIWLQFESKFESNLNQIQKDYQS